MPSHPPNSTRFDATRDDDGGEQFLNGRKREKFSAAFPQGRRFPQDTG
jgi:hypothetical protein